MTDSHPSLVHLKGYNLTVVNNNKKREGLRLPLERKTCVSANSSIHAVFGRILLLGWCACVNCSLCMGCSGRYGLLTTTNATNTLAIKAYKLSYICTPNKRFPPPELRPHEIVPTLSMMITKYQPKYSRFTVRLIGRLA